MFSFVTRRLAVAIPTLLILVVIIFAFFFVGDGLRDALDPKDR